MLGQELENLAQWHQACTLVFTEYSGQRANETSYFFCNFNVALFVVQSPSCVRVFVTPWTAASQASLSLTISWSLPKFMSIASAMPSSHLMLWCPLLHLPSISPSITNFGTQSCSTKYSFLHSLTTLGSVSYSKSPNISCSETALNFCFSFLF